MDVKRVRSGADGWVFHIYAKDTPALLEATVLRLYARKIPFAIGGPMHDLRRTLTVGPVDRLTALILSLEWTTEQLHRLRVSAERARQGAA